MKKNWIKKHGIFSGIAGAILTTFIAIIIALFPFFKNEEKLGVSVNGNVFVTGDSAITGKGNINISKTGSNVSDRIELIQKTLKTIEAKYPYDKEIIYKIINSINLNNIDEAEKLLQEYSLKKSNNIKNNKKN